MPPSFLVARTLKTDVTFDKVIENALRNIVKEIRVDRNTKRPFQAMSGDVWILFQRRVVKGRSELPHICIWHLGRNGAFRRKCLYVVQARQRE